MDVLPTTLSRNVSDLTQHNSPASNPCTALHLPPIPNKQSLEIESTSINMEITNYGSRVSNRSGRHIDSDTDSAPFSLRDGDGYALPPPFPTPDPRPSPFDYERGILYLVYVGALVAMYPSLTQLAQLKFQNKQSPFETDHAFFAHTSVVAYATAIPTSIILFYVDGSKERLSKESFYYIFYIILKSVFSFFGILAPLSLVLVLLIPNGFNWIGFSIMFALLAVVVAFAFNDYKNLPCK